jgi:hypothetical protein
MIRNSSGWKSWLVQREAYRPSRLILSTLSGPTWAGRIPAVVATLLVNGYGPQPGEHGHSASTRLTGRGRAMTGRARIAPRPDARATRHDRTRAQRAMTGRWLPL